MERREKIILEKVLSEIEIAGKIIGTSSLPEFLSDELLKRAACMTVINIGELVKNLPPVPGAPRAGSRAIKSPP